MNLRSLIIFGFLFFSFSANCQEFSDHYYMRKAEFEAEPDTQEEIILLGNSITEGGNWRTLFPNKNMVNRGISGDTTAGILNRLSEITSSQPRKIFLLVGTNDLAKGKTESYVLDHVETILRKIKNESSNTKLYLQSILPVNPYVGNKFSKHKKNQKLIVTVNRKLKELSTKMKVNFIDLHKKFKNHEGVLNKKYTYDGLHLNQKGYHKWKKELNPFIRKKT